MGFDMAIDVENLVGRRASNRWERVAVGDMLERMTWSFPEHDAIVGWEGAFSHPAYRRLTYRQADELTRRIANGLLAKGLTRGQRVFMVCENSVEAWALKLGIARAGLVAVPINTSLAPDVMAHIIRLVEPSFAFVDAEAWPQAKAAFQETSLKVGATIPIGGEVIDGSAAFHDFVQGASTEDPEVEIHGDDIWQLLFTSGTTAMPKGAMVSHVNSHLGAYGFALSLTRGVRIENQLRLCSFLPLTYHVGDQCFMLSVIVSGGTLVLGRRPSGEAIAQAISRERCTALWGGSPALVGQVAEALAKNHVALDARSLKIVVYGWGALPPGVTQALQTLCGPDLVPMGIFGQTEAIACHRFWPDVWRDLYLRTAPETNYVGVPSPLLASQVMDAEGKCLMNQPGVPGEAVYRSPVVMGGYYKDRAASEHAFRYGWFHSGDSCVYDTNGLRIMVDRFKDIVKSGGENVSTLRVEAVLAQHPAVQKPAVIGLAHPRWGEGVTAVVILRPGAERPAEAELIEFCRGKLAGFEMPKAVVFVNALPETVGGKVLKYKLRAEYAKLYEP